MFIQAIKEAIIILLIAIAMATGVYLLRTATLPVINGDAKTTPAVINDALFKPITIEQAEALFHQNDALFADARSHSEFKHQHISTALHLDPHEMDQWSDELMAQYPPEQIIITYCDGESCDLSKTLAEKITWLGFEQVYYLNNGWTQWQKRGLPIE